MAVWRDEHLQPFLENSKYDLKSELTLFGRVCQRRLDIQVKLKVVLSNF